MRPLCVEDVQIRVQVPITRSAAPLLDSTTSAAHVLPIPTPPQIPTPSALHLDDIRIQIHLSPAEALFHLPRPLSPPEKALVSGWLSRSVSLPFLRRLSSRLSHALSVAKSHNLVSRLEGRAHLVAEAMGVRVASATAADESADNREAELRRAAKLATERALLVAALDQFECKIKTFAGTDTATAVLLVPAREALRVRLHASTAELTAYGFSPEEKTQQKQDQAFTPPTARPQTLFVPDPGTDYLLLESESDTDESDLALAVRLPPVELEFGLPEPRFESGGYVSGQTNDDEDDACEELGNVKVRADVSDPTLCKANYVIDLDGSPEGSRTKIGMKLPGDGRAKQCVNNIVLAGRKNGREELEELGCAYPVDWRATRPISLLRRGSRISDEPEDGSDLEHNARKHRNRARESNRTRMRANESTTKNTDDEDECILF